MVLGYPADLVGTPSFREQREASQACHVWLESGIEVVEPKLDRRSCGRKTTRAVRPIDLFVANLKAAATIAKAA